MEPHALVADTEACRTMLGACTVIPISHKTNNLGRRAGKGPGKCALPLHYVQISGNHCTIEFVEGEGWRINDHSGNGSYLNGALVGKGNSKPLRAGDRLSLAWADEEPERLQFVFQTAAELPAELAAQLEAASKKRKETEANVAGIAKRSKPSGAQVAVPAAPSAATAKQPSASPSENIMAPVVRSLQKEIKELKEILEEARAAASSEKQEAAAAAVDKQRAEEALAREVEARKAAEEDAKGLQQQLRQQVERAQEERAAVERERDAELEAKQEVQKQLSQEEAARKQMSEEAEARLAAASDNWRRAEAELREAAAKEAEGLQVELRTTQEALTAEKSLVAGMRDSVAKAEAEMTVARSELEAARAAHLEVSGKLQAAEQATVTEQATREELAAEQARLAKLQDRLNTASSVAGNISSALASQDEEDRRTLSHCRALESVMHELQQATERRMEMRRECQDGLHFIMGKEGPAGSWGGASRRDEEEGPCNPEQMETQLDCYAGLMGFRARQQHDGEDAEMNAEEQSLVTGTPAEGMKEGYLGTLVDYRSPMTTLRMSSTANAGATPKTVQQSYVTSHSAEMKEGKENTQDSGNPSSSKGRSVTESASQKLRPCSQDQVSNGLLPAPVLLLKGMEQHHCQQEDIEVVVEDVAKALIASSLPARLDVLRKPEASLAASSEPGDSNHGSIRLGGQDPGFDV